MIEEHEGRQAVLEVTPEARLYLLRVLQEREAPADVAMRLTRSPDGFGVAPDTGQAGDCRFDFRHRTVLVVDRTLAEDMAGRRLGVVEDESGEVELHLEDS